MRELWLRPFRRLSRRFSRQNKEKPTSAQELGFNFTSLDTDAARRQAKLGRDYARTGQTSTRLQELNQGIINLPPHPTWEGDYTDWVADPFEDRNWRFQFHTLRWINPYLWDALAGSEASKQEWKRIVRSWAEHNTPPSQAQDDYAWKDMTDGNRAIQISIGAPLMDERDEWYLDLLAEHRNWLLDDANIVEGNHGLHQNLGLFVLAIVLNDETGIRRAIQRLADQILEAFDDKGLNEEGSVGYHQMNLIWWHQAQHRLRIEGHSLPSDAADRLEKAGRTMAYLLLPDGTMPQIGDGNRGKGRRGLHPLLDQVSNGKILEECLPAFKHYKNGFIILRSGWGESRKFKDEAHTVLRHGRNLLRHSHDDRGSIHLYTAGQRWITDGGFHSYQQNNADRIYTKSRLAHSLVDLPNQEHDQSGKVLVTLTENHEGRQSAEIVDNNFKDATWTRRVVFLTELHIWIIWDRIQSITEERIQQQWLLDTAISIDKLCPDRMILTNQQNKLHMRWLGDEPQFDIYVGDPHSDSKRGLIGLGWKTMKPTTSVHAVFRARKAESIVVISDPNVSSPTVEVSNRLSMVKFDLDLTTPSQKYRIEFREGSTEFHRPDLHRDE